MNTHDELSPFAIKILETLKSPANWSKFALLWIKSWNIFAICTLEWWFIYITQRVFGGNADGNTVSNADGCTMDGNKITPISLHDTANPIQPVKVNFASTSKHFYTATPPAPPLIENRRASWLIGWNTMWRTVGTTLKMPKKSCIKPACMRQKRERLGLSKITFRLTLDYRQFEIANLSSSLCTNVAPLSSIGQLCAEKSNSATAWLTTNIT